MKYFMLLFLTISLSSQLYCQLSTRIIGASDFHYFPQKLFVDGQDIYLLGSFNTYYPDAEGIPIEGFPTVGDVIIKVNEDLETLWLEEQSTFYESVGIIQHTARHINVLEENEVVIPRAPYVGILSCSDNPNIGKLSTKLNLLKVEADNNNVTDSFFGDQYCGQTTVVASYPYLDGIIVVDIRESGEATSDQLEMVFTYFDAQANLIWSNVYDQYLDGGINGWSYFPSRTVSESLDNSLFFFGLFQGNIALLETSFAGDSLDYHPLPIEANISPRKIIKNEVGNLVLYYEFMSTGTIMEVSSDGLVIQQKELGYSLRDIIKAPQGGYLICRNAYGDEATTEAFIVAQLDDSFNELHVKSYGGEIDQPLSIQLLGEDYIIGLGTRFNVFNQQDASKFYVFLDRIEQVLSSSTEIQPTINTISVFPNPANEFLYIKGLEKNIKLIECYSSNGWLQYKSDHLENSQLSLNAFPSGMYYYKIYLEGGERATGKFLVQHQ